MFFILLNLECAISAQFIECNFTLVR